MRERLQRALADAEARTREAKEELAKEGLERKRVEQALVEARAESAAAREKISADAKAQSELAEQISRS